MVRWGQKQLTRAVLATRQRVDRRGSRRGSAAAMVNGRRNVHHQVVIVGGGTAGLTVAAQLMRERRLETDVGGVAGLQSGPSHVGQAAHGRFKYGDEPKETFAPYPLVGGDQARPSRLYYHLKKDVFPFVYWNSFVKGTWYGPRTVFKPRYETR
ncbi:hypothetical protein P8C59_001053 [Phyllachora maydis]|uniref:Uncharacterized protein n=1 Tax=Phyllachora maydis TaxID=1825666 RepID=A0AAD9HYK3_9PEZI|nr:hypothetical protein P8C59_001053 [Phyllachora maydis]